MPLPTLETERLTLRPFRPGDAPEVRRLAGDRAIADTTSNIPHPYEEGMAEVWIGEHESAFSERRRVTLAIETADTVDLAGTVSLTLDTSANLAELGYWIGKPYWNLGYATEASRAMLAFGFDDLNLNRIQSRHFARNPASGRVMQKIGMQQEGTVRQAVVKWGKYEDLVTYAVLRQDWPGEARFP